MKNKKGADNYLWTQQDIASATHGRWLRVPPEDWRSTGFCHYVPVFQPGNILAVRTKEGEKGVSLNAARRLHPAAFMASTPLPESMSPFILVDDNNDALVGMGTSARTRMSGTIVGVTGSAGKSTLTAMLTHALTEAGYSAKGSAFNANLPVGVAWNLSSVPPDTEFVVTEMAIGKMGISSMMVRPDISVFTNIFPAHQGHHTLQDLARVKSDIFRGMPAGGTAVLNRDMRELGIVEEAAREKKLNLLFYGHSEKCDCQLISYTAETGEVIARTDDGILTFSMQARGVHMAVNAVATLALFQALKLPAQAAIPGLESFRPLPGRGETTALYLSGKKITVIDDSFNANPGSMAASFISLDEYPQHRCIAVLGQMEELGPAAERYHAELASLVNQSRIHKVICMGDLWRTFWNELATDKRGWYAKTLDEQWHCLMDVIAEGDVVLFKGSHSTGIHTLVEKIKTSGQTENV